MPGIDGKRFIEALEEPSPVTVRLNVRKPGAFFNDAEKVPWCENAFYLPQRPDFIFDPLLHAGAYYVQEASSTIYETVTKKLVEETGDNRLAILDLCAAPGGKTTAMINAMADGSFIWANEFVGKRAAVLRENLTKWGYDNIRITNLDTSFFADGSYLFDIVAVDAPCSGEGMMRKDETARRQWSPGLIEQCASLQRQILANAANAVKPGGFLVYSTCTFNTTENEDNALFIKNELGMEPFDLKLPKEWNIMSGIETDLPVIRFMPHQTLGEGLFLAVFRKPGERTPSLINQFLEDGERKSKKTKKPGNGKISAKEEKNTVPIEKILSADFDTSSYPCVSVTREEALSYLHGDILFLPEDTPRGQVIVTYGGFPLGAVNNIGQRANNLYPKNWRIKKSL